MRLRATKNQDEIIEKHPLVVNKPEEVKGKWRDFFGTDDPIYMEIGVGFGGFISEMSAQHPEVNFVGLEKFSKVMVKALKRFIEYLPENLALLCFDAEKLDTAFAENEIDRLYLNFSDPWPKARHAKRRLTYRTFLKRYNSILKPNGELHLKTDNDGLFEFSLEELKEYGWKILFETRDLHSSSEKEGNVPTEYEEKFSEQGHKINKLIAVRPTK